MSLKTLMKYLQQPVAVTPVTPDTPRFGDAHKNAQLGSVGEAVNDPDPPTAAPPTPTNPVKQTHQEWVATWQPLADAYHLHHFACPTCIAAGKGFGLRCGAGASLWVSYSGAG
jgi:hypothetical protein